MSAYSTCGDGCSLDALGCNLLKAVLQIGTEGILAAADHLMTWIIFQFEERDQRNVGIHIESAHTCNDLIIFRFLMNTTTTPLSLKGV